MTKSVKKTSFSILHTEWSEGWGGQERRILNEMVGMQTRGHRLVLATRPHARLALEAPKAGIETVCFPFKGKADIRTIFPLAHLARQFNIQMINTHSGIDSWIGAFASYLAKTRLVRTRHLNLPLKRSWHNFVHDMPDRIVTCGETMRQQLIQNCGFRAEELVSIPTGIDFEHFKPTQTRQETRKLLGLSQTEWVILMVGVIRAVKRHEVALRAFAQVYALHPHARLVLAGEGPMQRDMEQLAQQLGLQSAVKFLGHRNDIPNLMEMADCALLTSRSEGVPQAVTQGLGLGLPTVATAVGGVPELIQHEKTGLLAAPESVSEVRDHLIAFINHPTLAQELGQAGKHHVLTHFSFDAMLESTEQLYASVINP